MPALYGNAITHDSDTSEYWNNQSVLTGTTLNPVDASALNGAVVNLNFTRTVEATTHEDVATFALHFTVNAGVSPATDTALDAADAAVVETALGTFYTSLKTKISDSWTLRDYTWRNFGASFPRDVNGVTKYSPVWRTTTVGVLGTASGQRLPDQTAATVTWMTSSRQHWGRVYVPALTVTALTTYGKLTQATYVDNVCTYFHTLFNDLNDNARSINAVVWSPKYRAALSIRELQMDNVADVIRSRRPKFGTYRKQFTS